MKDKKLEWMSEKKYKVITTVQSYAIVALLLLVFFACFRTAVVPSLSMYPTLQVKEFLLCNKETDYDYDNIVIFHPSADDKTIFVKRVIGKGGDSIEVKDGSVYRNGEKLSASYTAETTMGYNMDTVVIPQDAYFVMGDNRNNSMDSHVIGTIPKSQCVGRVVFHAIPFWWDKTK